jgi:hypothetical protein
MKMLSPAEFAAKHGVSRALVSTWLLAGRIAGAEKREFAKLAIWQIPETSARPANKTGGRKPLGDKPLRDRRKKVSNNLG